MEEGFYPQVRRKEGMLRTPLDSMSRAGRGKKRERPFLYLHRSRRPQKRGDGGSTSLSQRKKGENSMLICVGEREEEEEKTRFPFLIKEALISMSGQEGKGGRKGRRLKNKSSHVVAAPEGGGGERRGRNRYRSFPFHDGARKAREKEN